jgi:hypothetical protein
MRGLLATILQGERDLSSLALPVRASMGADGPGSEPTSGAQLTRPAESTRGAQEPAQKGAPG